MARKQRVMAWCVIAVSATALGCREQFPHSFTWIASGDQKPTHPKPPEGGYYKNWDPYAATIELEPVQDVNPVRTQHVFVATVLDHEGKPLPNRRIEWIIAEGSVGDIVEVDESGFRASRGYKMTNHFAVSHTNNYAHVLDRGNDDPSDDVSLGVGQSWCVVTSPVEGTTHLVAYAPGIYDWEKHKVFAEKHWYDVAWEWPPPATNPTGTQHTMTTKVMKYSDGTPLVDYIVNWEIVSGPDARFDQGGTTASTRTNGEGLATVTMSQVQPVGGTNEIKIDIIRPEDVQCCKPAVHIATGTTQKTWIPPGIAIEKSAPATAMVNQEFQYNIVVRSTSQVPAQNVAVSDTLPDGIAYVSSQPAAQVSGQTLSWQLGEMGPGTSQQLMVTVRGTRTGQFHNCATVTAAQGLSDEACADTVITAPALALEKQCPAQALICEPITFTMVVRNTGDAPATNVTITDNLPNGLATQDGRTTATFNVGTLGAGESKQVQLTVNASQGGNFTNTAMATADNGLTAEASCSTRVLTPALVITKTGPSTRYVGRPVTYDLTVTNKGDVEATNTVLIDTLPSGVEFVSATEGGQVSGGRVTWNLGTMAMNASRTVSITVKATQRGTIRNVANVTATCTEASAEASTEIKGIPAILLEVIDIEDPVEVGSNSTYVITVTNQGSAIGTNIKISCTLDNEQEFVSAEGPTSHTVDGKNITFAPLPDLAPKAKATYKVTMKGISAGDARFAVTLISDQMRSPAQETESTNIY